MIIYFIDLSFSHLLYFLVSNLFFSNKYKVKQIFFIEKNWKGVFLLNFIKILFKDLKAEELVFRMMDIRESSGELSRLKQARRDLFNFHESVTSSEFYEDIKSLSDISEIQEDYIQNEILDGTIMDEGSVSRTLYILEVIHQHFSNLGIDRASLVMSKFPWSNEMQNFALSRNIQMIFTPNFNHFNFRKFLRSHPRIYNLLKSLKISKNIFQKNKNPMLNNYLFVEGRGDLVLENNGSNSDFFWQLNSDFPKENLAYLFRSEKERSLISNYGSLPVDGSLDLKDLIFHQSKQIRLLRKSGKSELKQFNEISNKYNTQYIYWYSLFKKNNIKTFLSWYKYDSSHIVIKDAINSLGGVSAIWQIAFDGIKNFECRTYADIMFSYSSHSLNLDLSLDSKIKYNVITGYPKDYSIELLKPSAKKLREGILKSGAKYIVSVFDENSGGDERWHTGHALQQENYSFLLEEMLRDKQLGLIFKPKTPKTLFNRLGDVGLLLEKAIATGRCKVLLDSGMYTSISSPVLVALASDLCIHGHLSAGTAALEAALSGTPTILIDREASVKNKLRQLPLGIVRFNSWQEAIYALRTYFQNKKIDNDFGNWESILDELDPYRDGLGAQRMGNYLNNIIQGMNSNLNTGEAMERAAEIFSLEWGSDKIKVNRNMH